MGIPLDEVVHFDLTTRGDSGVVDADSAPTFDVFEEATDTPILDDQTMTKRTSLTGNYRGTFTASAANGFEVGKWYNVIATGIVGGVTDKTVAMTFRVKPAEAQAGVPKVDLQYIKGTTSAGAVGYVGIDWGQVTNQSTAVALDNTSIDVVEQTNNVANPVTVGTINANVITASALATDAVNEIRDAITADSVLASGTADSGSTTTMVDAARTEADTDYWKGALIQFTSGTIAGQVRLITGFTPASDTITFTPATTQAVGTNTYRILAAGRVDIQLWQGTAPLALANSLVQVDMVRTLAEVEVPTMLQHFYDHDDPTAWYVDAKLTTAGETAISDLFDTYTVRAKYTRDNAAGKDWYDVRWYKNGLLIESGVTLAKVRVTESTAAGTVLINDRDMTEVGTTEAYFYEATSTSGAGSTNERQNVSKRYLVRYMATIDGGAREVEEIMGRDTA